MKSISPAHQKPEDMPRTFRFEHELEAQGGVQRTAAPYQYTKIYISLLTAPNLHGDPERFHGEPMGT